MKRIILGALCALSLACGGDDKPDPASRHFDYGAPAAPTYDEESAAAQGEFILSDGAAYRSSDDPLVAERAGGSLPSLPDSLGSALFGDEAVLMGVGGAPSKAVAAALGGGTFAPQAVGDGFDNPACATLVPGRITYSRCTISGVTGMDMELTGWVSRAGDVVAWDLDTTVTMSDTMTDVDFSMRLSATGSLTVTGSTIRGGARSDVAAVGSGNGMSVRMGYTTLADLDLTYQPSPSFCVTGGTLEVRRVWTERPPSSPTDPTMADQGAKLTWLGCDVVVVARSL